MFEDALRRLRVAPDADAATIRAAYVRMVKRYPPEQFPDRFAAVQQAWRVLSLADDYLEDMMEKVVEAHSAVEMGAELWPCPALSLPKFPNFSNVLDQAAREEALDIQLAVIAAAGVEWRS